MASPVRNASKPTLLPPGVSDFLRRRFIEGVGIAVALSGVALILALTSYRPEDPSLNTAMTGAARNWLGGTGAWCADILIQTSGLASWLAGIMLVVWGWRTGTHLGLGRLWLRFAALPVAMLLSAIALAGVPAPAGWPLKTGLGGFAGDVLLSTLADTGEMFGLDQIHVVALVAALAVIALITALGISFAEWCRAGLTLGRYGAAGARAGANGGRMGMRLGRWSWRAAARGREAIADLRREPRFGSTVASRTDRTDGSAVAGRRREPRISPTPRDPARRGDIVAPRRTKPAPGKRIESERQAKLDLAMAEEYQLPDLEVLEVAPAIAGGIVLDDEALAENARYLESVLADFGVLGEVVKVRPGPVVTLYEFEPAPGTKSSRIIGLSDDIARSMSAVAVRVAVIPGRNVMGIELPNADRETVSLKELLGSDAYERTGARLSLVLGKDIGGTPVIADLARMPHLLIAGTTGSGKSVAINTMILSLLYRLAPDQCRFIMIDPKMLELSVYDGIPHLLSPVVTDPGKAVVALRWAVREMEARYRSMSNLGVRNIATYNVRIAEALRKGVQLNRTVQTGFDPETGAPVYEEQPLNMEPLPHIVVVVDEMADLMLVAGKDVEASVQRLSQMARAAGIHLIMATQRPSVDVITGTIKANFPTRISFQVTSKIDSRTILGEGGAEQLLGHGDMLYMAGGGRLMRVHGPLVTDLEVERVVNSLRVQGEPEYLDEITEDDVPVSLPAGVGGSADDELYDRAIALVCRERKASTSFVQRHLQIGYNRAARIIERMEAEGVVSPANHVGKREVLARNIEDPIN